MNLLWFMNLLSMRLWVWNAYLVLLWNRDLAYPWALLPSGGPLSREFWQLTTPLTQKALNLGTILEMLFYKKSVHMMIWVHSLPKKCVLHLDQVVYCHVNKTSQQYSALYITYSHVSDGKIRAFAANWCLIVRTREDTSAALIVYPTLGRCHQHVAQCCENIQSSFRYTSSLFGLLLVS